MVTSKNIKEKREKSKKKRQINISYEKIENAVTHGTFKTLVDGKPIVENEEEEI